MQPAKTKAHSAAQQTRLNGQAAVSSANSAPASGLAPNLSAKLQVTKAYSPQSTGKTALNKPNFKAASSHLSNNLKTSLNKRPNSFKHAGWQLSNIKLKQNTNMPNNFDEPDYISPAGIRKAALNTKASIKQPASFAPKKSTVAYPPPHSEGNKAGVYNKTLTGDHQFNYRPHAQSYTSYKRPADVYHKSAPIAGNVAPHSLNAPPPPLKANESTTKDDFIKESHATPGKTNANQPMPLDFDASGLTNLNLQNDAPFEADDQAENLNNTTASLSEHEQALIDYYDFNWPDDFPDQLKINKDNPQFLKIAKHAALHNLNNHSFNEIYLKPIYQTYKSQLAQKQAELEALGPSADQRLGNILNWANNNLTADEVECLKANTRSADMVKLLENLIAKTSEFSPPSLKGASALNQPLTQAYLDERVADKRFKESPTFRAETFELFKRLYPDA